MRPPLAFVLILLLLCLSTAHASAESSDRLCQAQSVKAVVAARPQGTPEPTTTSVRYRWSGYFIIKVQQPAWGWSDWPDCPSDREIIGASNTFGGTGGMSADGNVVVCYLDRGNNTPLHACTFSATQGLVDLGTLDPARAASLGSFGFGANADGSVVVGAADVEPGGNQHAFRWTSAEGMLDLGSASGPAGGSRAFATSGDGSVVVGESDFPSGQRHPFMWTQSGGFQDLDPSGFGQARAISGDGRVVVGQNRSHAFRWTLDGGLSDLLGLPGRDSSTATGVSDNGMVVVGMAAPRPLSFRNSIGWDFGTSDTRAVRWTASGGMQDLTQLLADRGVDMTGLTLVAALGVSPDGQFITGAMTTAATPPDETIGFIAQICDDAVDACAAKPPAS